MLDKRRLIVGASLIAMCVVNLPSLRIGLFGDDYQHRRFILDHLHGAPVPTAWWNMFDGRVPIGPHAPDPSTLFGRLPWWSSPEFSFALLRPLSTATHFADYLLWPDSPVLMHVHNLLWLAGMLVVAAALYARVLGAGWAAALALGLLAVDHANTVSAAWIASRNTLLTAAFALLALLLYASRRARQATPLALLCAHASSEGGMVAWAYLLSYVVWLEPGSFRARLRSLLPCAVVSIAWLGSSSALGYGVRGSGIYIDPRADPWLFLRTGVHRFPELLELQLAFPRELASSLPEALRRAATTGAYVYLGALLGLAVWAARRSPAVRFFGSALLLGLVPQCSAGSFARLLLLSSFAAHGLVASVLEAFVTWCRERPRVRWLWLPLAAAIAIVHGVSAIAAPPGALAFSRSVEESVLRAARSLPTGAALRASTIMVLHYPDYLRSVFVGLYRRELFPPGPERMHVLGTTHPPILIARTARDAIELEPDLGYLIDPSSLLIRRPEDRFSVGDHFELGEASVEVLGLTPDGRPKRIRVRSPQLDDDSLLWVQWNEPMQRFDRFTLPAVGDFVRVLPPPAAPRPVILNSPRAAGRSSSSPQSQPE
jgi:hypothetical protein